MLHNAKFNYLIATVFSLTLLNAVSLQFPTSNPVSGFQIQTEAYAKKSGGRSGGGSFKKAPSSSSRSNRSSGSSRTSQPPSSRSTTPSPSSGSSRTNSTRPSLQSTPSPRNTSTRSPATPLRPASTPSVPPVYSPNPAPSSNLNQAPNNTNYSSSPAPQSPYPTPAENRTYSYPTPTGSSAIGVTSSRSEVYSNNSSGFNRVILLLVLGLLGIPIFIILFRLFSKLSSASNGNSGTVSLMEKERDNNIVTISKVQVALLVTETDVQGELSRLSLNADTDTPEGLWELLQESLLVLQRNSDAWSYVVSSSEAVQIDTAETAFQKLCFQERSKFSNETLSNVEGQIQTRPISSLSGDNPGCYVVITLLLGTADDKPLFGSIRSTDELKDALEQLSAMRSDYLMTFYLLWTPQQSGEGLSCDEMITEYTDLYRIA